MNNASPCIGHAAIGRAIINGLDEQSLNELYPSLLVLKKWSQQQQTLPNIQVCRHISQLIGPFAQHSCHFNDIRCIMSIRIIADSLLSHHEQQTGYRFSTQTRRQYPRKLFIETEPFEFVFGEMEMLRRSKSRGDETIRQLTTQVWLFMKCTAL